MLLFMYHDVFSPLVHCSKLNCAVKRYFLECYLFKTNEDEDANCATLLHTYRVKKTRLHTYNVLLLNQFRLRNIDNTPVMVKMFFFITQFLFWLTVTQVTKVTIKSSNWIRKSFKIDGLDKWITRWHTISILRNTILAINQCTSANGAKGEKCKKKSPAVSQIGVKNVTPTLIMNNFKKHIWT